MAVTLIASAGEGTSWSASPPPLFTRTPSADFGAVAGDVVVFAAHIQQKNSINPPAGWTYAGGGSLGLNSPTGAWYIQLDAGTYNDAHSFTWGTGAGTGADYSAWWGVFRGANATTPVSHASATNDVVVLPITVTVPGSALIEWVGTHSNDAAALASVGPVNGGTLAFMSNPVQWEANGAAFYRLNVGGSGTPGPSVGVILTTPPTGDPSVPSSTAPVYGGWDRITTQIVIRP